MLSKAIAQEVLSVAMETGADFAEIFLEDRRNHSVSMRSSKIENVLSNRIHGAGVRVFVKTNAIYVYTNDTSREGLLACAKKAASAVSAEGRCNPVDFNTGNTINMHPVRLSPDDVKASDKAAKLRICDKIARQNAEIAQVAVSYKDSVQDVWIANSEGVFVTDRRTYSRMACMAIATNGTENQTGHYAPGGLMGFELFDSRVDPEAVGKAAALQAVTMLHAPACPAGIMPVAIDNGFGGVIFHEACGHSLEATSVAPGLSEFSGKLGQKIAADCVTAIDDGTMKNEWGSETVDDEGTPTTRLVLIENGVLKNYMVDRIGSRRMNNMPITGSARRESYAYAPTSRMRNTYIAPGNDSNEEIIASMGDGLYAKSMGGGSVNPVTGEFNFAVDEGYMVKDGKIDHPVRGASLIGKGGEILMKIDRVGKDMRMAPGMCGSVSGSVPTNVGQPMIRVSSITVGGRA